MKTATSLARKVGFWALLVGVVFGVVLFRQRWPFGPRVLVPDAPQSSATNSNAPDRSPIAVLAVSSLDDRWQKWFSRLSEPGHESELAAEFEALVAADPARAFANAERQADSAKRIRLVRAVLMLWAQANPTAAAAKAAKLSDADRANGVAAVLAGAARQPALAVYLANQFCRNDPTLASEHGYALVNALGRVGAFREAIRFAVGDEKAPDDEDHNKWLKTAFAQWAAKNPTAAMAGIQELPLANARFEALDAIAQSQVRTDPIGLTEALRRMPSAPDRNFALGQTLQVWVRNDPKTAADWLDRLESSPELDEGAAALAAATLAHNFHSRPEVALSWGESIVAPELRSRTLASVIQKWSELDRASALEYVRTSPNLLLDDRLALTKALTEARRQ